jgi:outer membrane protein assembly factor BamE (lipoprotein component of BamABCDE complex)
MVTKKQLLNVTRFIFAIFLTAILAACTSLGSSNLSKSTVDAFEEGKTTKDQIASALGHPKQMMNFDKKGIEDYMYRVFLKRPPEDMFPRDKYEVWTYNKWSYAASPIPFTSHESEKNSIFIFDSNGVLVKKFFSQKGKFRF